MLPDVLRLSPVAVTRPWGGRRLADFGRELPEGPVGESWDVADLPDGVAKGVDDPRSRVLGGPWDGAALADLVEREQIGLLGAVRPTHEGRFPLLVKLLDARENLSVQVHPHAAYVEAHPEARLKTESWWVVDAEPGSSLYLDLDQGATDAEVHAAVGTPRIVSLMNEHPASTGAFHHVPAGRVHALGGGCLVFEVQTPSDTTFRMYDWSIETGRAPRDLHVDQALASIVRRDPSAISLGPLEGPGSRALIDTPHYRMVEHRSDGSPVAIEGGELALVSVFGSPGEIGGVALAAGETVVRPASSGADVVEVESGGVVIETRPVG